MYKQNKIKEAAKSCLMGKYERKKGSFPRKFILFNLIYFEVQKSYYTFPFVLTEQELHMTVVQCDIGY